MGSSLMRWGRHAWHALGSDGRWLDAAARQRIAERIAASEAGHGGEIRVCIERALPAAALRQGVTARQRAQLCFGELGVWDTAERCGVLVYLLLAERAIELVADRGITERVPAAQWQALVDSLASALRDGRREAGLIVVIDALDALLRQHFPLRAEQANPNELPDVPVLR
jgi:uncharacterized membrane protein